MNDPAWNIMRSVALLAAFLVCGSSGASGWENPTIRARAKIFYEWYLRHDSDRIAPLDQLDLRSYVTRNLISRLQKSRRDGDYDEDYFLKVQDYDEVDWNTHITVSKPVGPPGHPRLLVTLGSHDKAVLCVHLRRAGHLWKIDQVEDENFRSAFPGCRTRISG